MSPIEVPWPVQFSLPPLCFLVVLPLLAMAVSLAARSPRQATIAGLTGAASVLALAISLRLHATSDRLAYQFVEQVSVGPFNHHFGVDGIALLFVLLTALITLLAVLYREAVDERPPGLYVATLFALEASLMGMFLSLDLLEFWLFACLELIPGSYVLRRWGTGPDPASASAAYRRFAIAGLVLLLTAVLLVGWSHARSVGRWSFDAVELSRHPAPDAWQATIFVLMFYGLAVRLAQFPFHAWLPIVAREGTLATIGLFLVGIKVGIYALLRFGLTLLPAGVTHWQNFLILLGVIGMFYGGILALMQLGLRRLLAYAAISNTGMLIVGVLSLNQQGLMGTLLLTIAFGLAACGLLLTVGLLHRRARTTLLPRLGALFESQPLTGLMFLIAALSTMAMPGTPGFDAAHLLLEGAIAASNWATAAAVALGNVVTAAFLLWAFQRAFLADRREQRLRPLTQALSRSETALALLVCGALIGVGFYTEPWENLVRVPVSAITERFASTHDDTIQ